MAHVELAPCAGTGSSGGPCRNLTGRPDGYCGACWVPEGHRSAVAFAPGSAAVDPCAARGYRCCQGLSPADSSCLTRGGRLAGGAGAIVDARLRCGNGYWWQPLTLIASCAACGGPIIPDNGTWTHLIDAHHRCGHAADPVCTAWPDTATLEEVPGVSAGAQLGDRFVQADGSFQPLTSIGALVDDNGTIGYMCTTAAGNRVVAAPAPERTPGWVPASGLARPVSAARSNRQAVRVAALERAATRAQVDTIDLWMSATSVHAYEAALHASLEADGGPEDEHPPARPLRIDAP